MLKFYVYTDTLLANIVRSREYEMGAIMYSDLVYCLFRICNCINISGPIGSDLSPEAIQEIVEQHPKLFRTASYSTDRDPVVIPGEYKPNMDFFNGRYQSDNIEKIRIIIDEHLKAAKIEGWRNNPVYGYPTNLFRVGGYWTHNKVVPSQPHIPMDIEERARQFKKS